MDPTTNSAKFPKKSIINNNLIGFRFATPFFPDGQANGTFALRYSLLSRDAICDNNEMIARGHHYDGLVLIPG